MRYNMCMSAEQDMHSLGNVVEEILSALDDAKSKTKKNAQSVDEIKKNVANSLKSKVPGWEKDMTTY